LRLFRSLLEQMKREPLSGLPAYPREPGEFGNQLLDGAHRSERRRKGQLRHFPHLGVEHLGRATLSLGYRGEHQITEEIGVVVLEDDWIDRDRSDGTAAISGHLHHSAAGGGLDGASGQLRLQLLQPALHLLSQLKELLKIRHAIG
jgi:hypothetical protein